MQNPTATWPRKRAGLLFVTVEDASPKWVRFYCGPSYESRAGYTYAPFGNIPLQFDEFGNIPLSGPWYESTWPRLYHPADDGACIAAGDDSGAMSRTPFGAPLFIYA